jgi:hypothetical protein
MQRTRNQHVSHARLVAGGGSCAPLMPGVGRLPQVRQCTITISKGDYPMSMKENSANIEGGSYVSNERKDRQADNLRTTYAELCNSYRAIDDFRTKLLGFLPLATIAGIFVLVTDQEKMKVAQPYFWPLGVFGFVITLGLFFFELYGIKKCTHLIRAGKELEKELDVDGGQFRKRPQGVAGLINEPLASGVIYPAVLAAWTFLALASPQSQDAAQRCALRVFLIGFAFSFIYDVILILEWDKKIRRMIVSEKPSPTCASSKGEAD